MSPPARPPSTAHPLPVGNDLVDLTEARCRGRSRDERFLARVLADSERARIAEVLASGGEAAADRLLWKGWAAKEAAFKVASKGPEGPPVFEHAAFVVDWTGADGTVAWRGRRFRVRAVDTDSADRIHLVALETEDETAWASVRSGLRAVEWRSRERPTDPAPPDAPTDDDFTDRERPALHSDASRWVRAEARAAVAGLLGVTPERLEVVPAIQGLPGRTPPRLLLDGRPAPLDLSLSHHGRFVAWAVSGVDG